MSALTRQLAISLTLFIIIILSIVLGLRYFIVRPITCIPNCIGENFLGRDLRGLNLSQTNFVEANFQGADLSETTLRQVDMSGANLLNANLRNADLSEAQLIGSNLSGADLGGSTLSGANLNGAILDGADLTAVDLSDVSLKGSSFGESKLTNANMHSAKLNGIQFAKANLSGAILDFAGLSGSNLSQADLSGASLQSSDLTGAWLNLSNLTGANLNNADLSGSRLIGSELTSANLEGSRLRGAIVIGANLNGANVRGADLRLMQGLAEQLNEEELQLDPVLAELNELQQRELVKDVEIQGLAYDATTQWDPLLRPDGVPDVASDDASELATTDGAEDTQQTFTFSSAQRIKVNFYVNSLHNLPDRPGAYEIDFFLDSFWHEPELDAADLPEIDSNDPDLANIDELRPALTDEQIARFFDPFLEVVNAGQVQEVGRRYELSTEPGTNVHLRQRMVAVFFPSLDLRHFPFDDQMVSIQIESAEYDSESLRLDFLGLLELVEQSEIPYIQKVPRGRYIDVRAGNPDWLVWDVNILQLIHILPFDNSAWSQFRVDLSVKRVAAGYLWRILVVLASLWLMVGSVFLLNSAALSMRLWLLFLLFWIVVAFQAVVTRVVPPTDALTLLDRYLLICYSAIVITAILVIVIKFLHSRNWHRWVRWSNSAGLIFYSIIFIVGNILLLTDALR
ncbi:MAG: pentapeptide repeat-containing protein [Chloroflexota bacterium]